MACRMCLFVRFDVSKQVINLLEDRLGLICHACTGGRDLTGKVNHIAVCDDLAHAVIGVVTCKSGYDIFFLMFGLEADGHDKCHNDGEKKDGFCHEDDPIAGFNSHNSCEAGFDAERGYCDDKAPTR